MFRSRSIAAYPPSLDRESIRAALVRQAPWPTSAEKLAEEVCSIIGRPDGRWVAKPEEALLQALLTRTGGGGPAGPKIAAPALGRPGYRKLLERFRQVHWMEPAAGQIDPGMEEIAEALDWGAQAVLLTPISGNCSGLANAAQLCGEAGALLMVDARAAMGTRILESGPESFGDICLVPVDCEPNPSPCPGAILFGAPGLAEPTPAPPNAYTWALQTLVRSLRDEPRLRRLLAPGGQLPERRPRLPRFEAPPLWAMAVATVRMRQAASRASQRAHHVRALAQHCGNVPAVRIVLDEPGVQSAGGTFPMMAQGRDEMLPLLAECGIEAVPDGFEFIAPIEGRGDRATVLGSQLLLLPLHPFYGPRDIDAIAEALRRATVRVNGVGSGDPTEGL